MKKIRNTYKGLPMHTYPGLHAKILSIVQELLPKGSYVLDVGAGEGAFSKRLQDSGYKVDALEPFYNFSLPGINHIKLKVGSKDYFRWINKHRSQYDLIVAIEVIEHLKDPWGFISTTYPLLKKGGFLIISTPNISSCFSRVKFLFSGRFHQFDAQDLLYGHIHPLDVFHIKHILASEGYKIVDIQSFGRIPWLAFKSIKMLIYRLLSFLLFPLMRGRKKGWVIILVSQKS